MMAATKTTQQVRYPPLAFGFAVVLTRAPVA